MAELVDDCPRCGAKNITFNVLSAVYRFKKFDWKKYYELFCQCRNCLKTTIFLVGMKRNGNESLFRDGFPLGFGNALNNLVSVEAFISTKDMAAEQPPEHLPDDIDRIFREATTCLATRCWNASGTMFRTTIDLATRPLLPANETEDSPPGKVRRDLGLRLPWLFDQKLLPEDLRDLSTCIREDGNDGAHEGTLEKVDAEDLRDFTRTLLERLYTVPERLRIAERRRTDRRSGKDG